MHVMDLGLVNKVTPLRKSLAYALQVPRALTRCFADRESYVRNPPIIVNSIPKSGTHLLMQVARALPGTHYYGSFLAQHPSLTLRKRTQAEISRGIQRLVPGEVIGAHLHYTPETARAFQECNAFHLMIIRDPLDVLLSEAHYLRNMARFHRMHGEFKNLSAEEAIDRTLSGSARVPEIFPSFAERIKPYCGWMDDPDCYIIRYEDTRKGEKAADTVQAVVLRWAEKSGYNGNDLEAVVNQALLAINPSKSHTYSNRKGPDGDLRQRLECNVEISYLKRILKYTQCVPRRC